MSVKMNPIHEDHITSAGFGFGKSLRMILGLVVLLVLFFVGGFVNGHLQASRIVGHWESVAPGQYRSYYFHESGSVFHMNRLGDSARWSIFGSRIRVVGWNHYVGSFHLSDDTLTIDWDGSRNGRWHLIRVTD